MSRLTLMADHPLPLKEWETKTLTVLVHELCGEICEQKRSKEGRVYFCSQFKGAAYRGGEVKGAGSVGPIAFAVRKKGAMNVLIAKLLCFSIVCSVGPTPKEWCHHF